MEESKITVQSIASFSELLREEDIIILEEVDSTNNYAKVLAEEGKPAGTLVIADLQTAGRGRMGRTFVSPKKSGIYMSLILRPGKDYIDAIPITTAVSVGVCRAISHLTGKEVGIKWVNDIYIAGKKVCGILVEAVPDKKTGDLDSVIVGIGIDYMKPSPEVLSQIPKDVLAEMDWIYDKTQEEKKSFRSRPTVSRSQLVGKVADEVLKNCINMSDRKFIEEYKQKSIVLGKKIVFISEGVKQSALALDIDNDGGLVVKLPDGNEKNLYSGEISVRLDV